MTACSPQAGSAVDGTDDGQATDWLPATDGGEDGALDGDADGGSDDGGPNDDGDDDDDDDDTDHVDLDEYCTDYEPPEHEDWHSDDPDQHEEHHAALNLLLDADATHVAVACGNWSDPKVWADGKVPDVAADVLIPGGVGVRYDVSDGPKLHFVKVAGYLEFATDADTQMRVDTLVTTPQSFFRMGRVGRPVEADATASLTVIDAGALDPAVDPLRLSRGVILHGTTTVAGTAKTAFVPLADAPMSGATELQLGQAPEGWRVGDEVLVVGTHRDQGLERMGQQRSEDEQRIITAVGDGTLTLDRPLAFDHDVPSGYELTGYVANLTRNVQVRSEDPDGVRGHFMVMHVPGADVRYAGFHDLGRTDRRQPVSDTNVIGRYSLHFHQTGAAADDEWSVAVGNVVQGNPAWGIVHHGARAAINHNVVFDVIGAGIVAEAGSEVGEWVGNLVTSVTGADTDGYNGNEILELFGPGTIGEAYSAMSRAVLQKDNVAANSAVGWRFEGRVGPISEGLAGGHVPDRKAYVFDPVPLHSWTNSGEGQPDPDFLQFVDFRNNEVIACDTGMRSSHRGSWYRPGTDIINEVVEFRAWRVHSGVFFGNYTWDYTFLDSLLLGDGSGLGINLWGKIENINVTDSVIAGFGVGFSYRLLNNKGVLVGTEFSDNDTDISSEPEAYPLTILPSGSVTPVDEVTLQIDPDVDLTLTPGGRTISLAGTVTDSIGEYPFAHYHHWHNADLEEKVLSFTARLVAPDHPLVDDGMGTATVDEIVTHHGTLLLDDGTWVMPVVFWVGDRLTGHNYPVRVDFTLVDFDEAFLVEHQLESFVLPDHTPSYLDDSM